MTKLFLGVVGVAVLGFVADADASTIPAYSALPVGKLSTPDVASRPKNVPAKEKAPGFKVVAGDTSDRSTLLVLGEDQAKAKRTSGLVVTPATTGELGACYNQEQNAFMKGATSGGFFPFGFDEDEVAVKEEEPKAKEWEGRMSWAAPVWPKQMKGGVALLHRERVVENGSDVSLEFADAWFDSRTSGVKVASTTTLPLKQVATGPGGLRILAGRDERSATSRLVQFVVVRPKDTPTQFAEATIFRSDGTVMGKAACAHSRVGVAVTDGGSSAIIELPAVLPETHPGENSALSHMPALPPGSKAADIRTRKLRVQVSVSKTSRDKEPVVAVTSGWAEEEQQIQRLFDPGPMQPPPAPERFGGDPLSAGF